MGKSKSFLFVGIILCFVGVLGSRWFGPFVILLWGGIVLVILSFVKERKRKKQSLMESLPIQMNEQEELLVSSEDKSIVLTSQRIIQRGTINNEVNLKSITSYELSKSTRNTFKISSVVSASLTIIPYSIMGQMEKNGHFGRDYEDLQGFVLFFFIATITSVVLMFLKQEKKLKINGNYGTLEFFVSSMNENSLNNFINAMNSQRQKLNG